MVLLGWHAPFLIDGAQGGVDFIFAHALRAELCGKGL
jgi:hypothetical protein